MIIAEKMSLSVPPSRVIEAYLSYYPDAAKKFFEWAEKEGEHRRKQDEKLVDSYIGDSRLGLFFGLIVALSGLGAAVFAVYMGQQWVACILGGSTIVSLATAFLRGSQSKIPFSKTKRANPTHPNRQDS